MGFTVLIHIGGCITVSVKMFWGFSFHKFIITDCPEKCYQKNIYFKRKNIHFAQYIAYSCTNLPTKIKVQHLNLDNPSNNKMNCL